MSIRRTIFTAAKINLWLLVHELDQFGFHPLETVYQSIDLYDRLECSAIALPEGALDIVLEADANKLSQQIPLDQNNLIYQAIEMFFDTAEKQGKIKTQSYQIKCKISKNIPIAGGLAGGSSNAAGILYFLNYQVFDGLFKKNELMKIASQLGKDIPFCLEGGCMLGMNYGENITSLPMYINPSLLLVHPPSSEGLSARAVYQRYDQIPISEKNRPCGSESYISFLVNNDLERSIKYLHNDLQDAAISLSSWIDQTLQDISQLGYHAIVSGSGSSIYVLGRDQELLEPLQIKLIQKGYNTSLHNFTEKSILF